MSTKTVKKEKEEKIEKSELTEEFPIDEVEEFSKKETEKIDEGESPKSLRLEDIPGLGPKSAKLLRDGGITDPQQLMEIPMDRFDEIGMTRTTAKKLREGVKSLFPTYYSSFVEQFNLEDVEGIGPTTASAMREKGLNIHMLENAPLRELEENYGISPSTAIKYRNFIVENVKGGWFSDALSYYNSQKITKNITFGADSLDLLFAIPEIGSTGIRAGETYEFFGAFRSGKSQLCHQLAMTVQLPTELGGLGKKAIYLDTEGTFSPTRISQMATRLRQEYGWDKPVDAILHDIMYARIKNSDTQQAVSYKLLELLGEKTDEFGLLVIDSVTSHFRAEYAGRGTLAERQQTLNHHLSVLHRIADTYGLAVIVTNQVQANPAQFFGDPTQAVGGNIMGHWAGTRCYLRKSKGEKRVIRIFDSPVLGENEAIFEITEQGVLTSS